MQCLHPLIRHPRAVVAAVVKVIENESGDDVVNENVESGKRKSIVRVVVAVDERQRRTKSIESGAGGETILHHLHRRVTIRVASHRPRWKVVTRRIEENITSVSGGTTIMKTSTGGKDGVREMMMLMGRIGNETTELINLRRRCCWSWRRIPYK